ncbi:Tubulin polyglutamylase TTLL13 [Holothuria leucospilota]|uniref:Tubulin polyglutamylase TTLL13 n=1 Tax=Holothuria leucospilota TaxID=206669 RepID=A0A9Q1H1U8_HOLLE|nr:Tubulin polyglutamylase TTLL13 [Holothuria leucospilota]
MVEKTSEPDSGISSTPSKSTPVSHSAKSKDSENVDFVDKEQEEETEDEGEGFLEEDEGEGGRDSGLEETHAGEAKKEPEKRCPSPKKRRRRKKRVIGINLTNCKYDSVRRMSKKFGMKEVGEDEDWTLYWTDYSVALERVMEMKRYQKINHFPGMSEICRKDLLARNLMRLLKLFPKEYAVFPRTWVLPADYGDFQAFCRSKKNKTYICKPESGCQGRGIFITKNPKDIKPGEHMVLQQYVSKQPFLIDGFKMDFRVYVLVTSCDPLRIYVFNDGLARFATMKYSEPTNGNVDDVCMHLTNYAINKHSSDFVRDNDIGSKRKISTVNQWFDDHGYDKEKIWDDIHDVIIKTLISAHPILKHNYRTCFPNHIKGSACFEILGFDIMLDKKQRPWLLEVNHSPSFHTDSKLDKEVKEELLYNTMCLINLTPFDRKRCIEEERRRVKERLLQRGKPKEFRKEEYEESQATAAEIQMKFEDAHLGSFRRIFPSEDSEKYDRYFQHSGSLFQETAASKARGECARQQREEIKAKQEKLEMMLRKKPAEKKDPNGLRPESPSGDGRNRRKTRPLVPRVASISKRSSLSRGSAETKLTDSEPLDTTQPMDILEDEELDRISGLLQRDNLVRGLGVVEHVYRLLHCTPGTIGVMKNAERQPNINSIQVVSASNSLVNFLDTKMSTILPSTTGKAVRKDSTNQQTLKKASASSRMYPHPPSGNTGVPSHAPFQSSRGMRFSTNPHELYTGSAGTTSSGLIQRQRLMPRKGFSSQRDVRYDHSTTGDWRSVTTMLDNDRRGSGPSLTVGNRSNSYMNLNMNANAQGDWRGSDSHLSIGSAPPRRAFNDTISDQRREFGPYGGSGQNFPNLLRISPSPSLTHTLQATNVPSLSVVSGPAPVVHRPDLNSAPGRTSVSRESGSNLRVDNTALRSTKSQRIRGVSNTLRLKQLELKENHAVVLS